MLINLVFKNIFNTLLLCLASRNSAYSFLGGSFLSNAMLIRVYMYREK